MLQEGDPAALEEMLAKEPELLRARDPVGRSLPLVAVYTGQVSLAWDLIRRGAPEEIHEASAIGDRDHVERLLGKDPQDRDRYSPDGWTPLHLASFFGHPQIAVLLLDRGADPSAIAHNALANQPVHVAVAGGHVSSVRLLMERGADVRSHLCQGGATPLHLAADLGAVEMVVALLDGGAEVGAPNETGQTPVDVARRSGHEEVARLLIRYGARDLRPFRAGTSSR